MKGKKPNLEDVEAIFVADIHLCLKPPVCRSGEKDWLATQAGYLKQLRDLSGRQRRITSEGLLYRDIPIICSGDIFNRWDADKSPELLNWAIDYLPFMYAIPGNHDLPNHQYADIKKSAYWTLVQAGKIIDLKHDRPTTVGNLCIHARPFGVEPQQYTFTKNSMVLDIVVAHEYVWMKGAGYQGASEASHLKSFRSRSWKGVDLVVLGDNHTTFYAPKGIPLVLNPGGFMRRTVLEVDHKPSVWLLNRDQTLTPYYLDISKDVLTTKKDLVKGLVKGTINSDELIKELKQDKTVSVCFVEAMTRHVRDGGYSRRVRGIITEIIEEIAK